ncbi:MAG: hypothetical protein AAFO02_22680 [Bacteroidota bacterium]
MNFLTKIITYFTDHPAIHFSQILLTGSKVAMAQVDFWSDTDLILVSPPEVALPENAIKTVTADLGVVIGQEQYWSVSVCTIRLVILIDDQVERLDLKFCTHDYWISQESSIIKEVRLLYQSEQSVAASKPISLSLAKYPLKKVDELWFRMFECVKKFMRQDHLIGLHLLMGILQDYLVLQMQKRDQREGTTIHRKGFAERLPVDLELHQINYTDKDALLDYINRLASYIDQELLVSTPSYFSRSQYLSEYITKSKAFIRGR